MNSAVDPLTTALIWAGSLAVVANGADLPHHFGNTFMLDFDGVKVPIVTSVLSVLGVLLARPFTPKREPPLGKFKEILLTIILIMLSLAWVIDNQPRIIFALIIAFGLGFSGFSIVELLGEETQSLFRQAFASLGAIFDKISGKGRT